MKKYITQKQRGSSAKTRSASRRAYKQVHDDANRIMKQYSGSSEHTTGRLFSGSKHPNKLKVTFLGGLEDVGEKNMAVIEYGDEAIILDCGNSLGIDLPGVNYTINDTAYLETIKHKIKAYVITHGHLDHIGGLRHTLPDYPAPIYGSRYTIGLIDKLFEDLKFETGKDIRPELITAQLDTHEKHIIGDFSVEFIRVTHALPDAAAVSIETPVGRIVATGDFRLDPEPLDKMPSDTTRLKELGDQGVLLLLSDSSYADVEGRVPTESTLQESFYDIIGHASGRIFVAAFSSNMNRTQMIINAAVAAGRHVALDGRGMLSYAEIAVRQGILKIPKGTVVPIQRASTIDSNKLLVMCTGGQGEPHAALQRMSEGEHRHVNLSEGDTVVISSSPIPGNEVSYDRLSNRLKMRGVHLFRHPTHEVDGCGPLHVSGHARRGELRDMLQLVRPKFFIPVHAGALRRSYHADLGVEVGIPRKNIMLPNNGGCVYIDEQSITNGGQVPHGSLLIDQNGSIVSKAAVKDKLILRDQGIVTIVLTIDNTSGRLLISPEVVSHGVELSQDQEAIIQELKIELKRAVKQRFGRLDVEKFKVELREHVSHILFEHTGNTPLIIPLINRVNDTSGKYTTRADSLDSNKRSKEHDQMRFQEMRAKLLGADQRD